MTALHNDPQLFWFSPPVSIVASADISNIRQSMEATCLKGLGVCFAASVGLFGDVSRRRRLPTARNDGLGSSEHWQLISAKSLHAHQSRQKQFVDRLFHRSFTPRNAHGENRTLLQVFTFGEILNFDQCQSRCAQVNNWRGVWALRLTTIATRLKGCGWISRSQK